MLAFTMYLKIFVFNLCDYLEWASKKQPRINYLSFKIYKSLRYNFFKDLQLVNFLSSAKILKPKTDYKFINDIFLGSFLFSTCTKLMSKSM